jgi:hypothetical protein
MFVLVLLLIGTFTFAAEFAPIQLGLSTPGDIEFKGGSIDIPVTVTGTPATVIFMVFTNNKGGTIEAVRNGYLGWHYVNGIDTCLFVSSPFPFGTGENTITWLGNDADGNAVPADEGDGYKYYLYGYDHETAKQLAAPVATGWENATMWRQFNPDGTPMTYPELYPSVWHGSSELASVTRTKWIMGDDVTNSGLIETCSYLSYQEHSPYVPSPESLTDFFALSIDGASTGHVRKYEWTPNGEAILDDGWGEAGEVTFSLVTTPSGEWVMYVGAIDIGEDLIMASATDLSGVSTESILKLISVSGGYVDNSLDLTSWWIRMDDGLEENGGQQSSGPNDFDFQNGMLAMGSHSTCMNQMIDPHADVEDELAWNKWVNQNGDYTGDHNFEETAENPWICHDYAVGPYKYNTDIDALGFVAFPAYDCGAVTYGLYAPDGTGLSYYAAAGEHASAKWMAKFLDNGSAYDGLYTDGMNLGEAGTFFIAQDSMMGYLKYEVSVEEDAPAQFAVAQNSPNPFNPTTTISFEIADPGTVTIDVYNVAGQKVDTIVNEYMEDGTHSRVWDATGFSAGVYFYTVKSGNMSKTMSMTLLK